MGGVMIQAVRATPPGPGTKTSLTTTSTAAVDLSAFQGQFVVLYSSVETHLRWGESDVGAATTNDIPIPAQQHVPYFIPESGKRSFFRAILASGTGDLYHADASDPT